MTWGPASDSPLRRVIDTAALSEVFDPLELARVEGGGVVDPGLIKVLADLSEEVFFGGATKWRLTSEARRSHLTDLAWSNQLGAAIEGLGEPTTDFSRYLVNALLGQPLEEAPVKRLERETAIIAYEIAAASLAASPDVNSAQTVAEEGLAVLRSRSLFEAEEARSRTILPGDLIGRVEERAAIARYIESGQPDEPQLEPLSPRRTLRPLLIHGCGGAGKSALLADTIRTRRELSTGWDPVVLIDFDRPANCRGGAIQWYSELTRQISLGRPSLAQRLKRVRSDARSTKEATQNTDDIAAERMRAALPSVLAEEAAVGAHLLIVLDTFEEVLTRSNLTDPDRSLFGDVLRWAADVASIEMPDSPQRAFGTVRVIVSGRSSPDLGDALWSWFCGEMEIGALLPDDAITFLMSRDQKKRLNKERARRAVEVVGGHPLSLILLERFVRNQPSLDEVDWVVGQGDLAKIMSGEDAARTLYTRFLQRLTVEQVRDSPIDPEKVRLIAHPGLVLREVTAERIEKIIAPACHVSLVHGEADDLFRSLINQVWLVETLKGRSPQTVRHRPDVRRLLLPLMSGIVGESEIATKADLELREKVKAVHELAVRWFQQRSVQPLDEYEVEAAYHRGFLDDIDALVENGPLWRMVWNLAPDDVPAMPPRASALIRYYGRGASSLSFEQAAIVPARLFKAVAVERTTDSINSGRITEAVANIGITMSESSEVGRSLSDPEMQMHPRKLNEIIQDRGLGAQVNSRFLVGDFELAATIAWRALMELEDSLGPSALLIKDGLTNHWIWRAAMARMVAPHSIPDQHWLDNRFEACLTSVENSSLEGASARLAMTAVLYLASAGEARSLQGRERLLFALSASMGVVNDVNDARLLGMMVAAVGDGFQIDAKVQAATVPYAQFRGSQLNFPRVGKSRASRLPTNYLERREIFDTNAFALLAGRLPELEEVSLSIIAPAIQDEPERLFAAIGTLERLLPSDHPSELDAEMLRKRVGSEPISRTMLAGMLHSANEFAVLPDLLAGLVKHGGPSYPLETLLVLIQTYRRVLGSPFI